MQAGERTTATACAIVTEGGLPHLPPRGKHIVLDQGIIEGDAIPDLFIPELIELYGQGRFPFDRLITFYPFDDINKAVKDMEEGRVIKPVLRLWHQQIRR